MASRNANVRVVRKELILRYVVTFILCNFVISCAKNKSSVDKQAIIEHSVCPENAYYSISDKTPSDTAAYDLCFVSRVRNMAADIPVWLEYHALLGVKHFFLVDDCSTDDTLTSQILSGYHDTTNIVTHYSNPFSDCSFNKTHQPNEKELINYLVRQAKQQCLYIGVIDVDEYIAMSDRALWCSLPDYIRTSTRGVLRLQWALMSSNGIERMQNGFVFDVFRYLEHNTHTKTIARSDMFSTWDNSHYPTFHDDITERATYMSFALESEYHQITINGIECKIPRIPIFLKHFVARSWDEFILTRGSRLKTSDGHENPWAKNPRRQWESLNIDTKCKFADEHADAMAASVKEVLSTRRFLFDIPIAQYRSLKN